MHAVEIFELVLILLALVLGLHWLALKLNWPSATVLLVGGGALAFVPGLPEVSLDPQLALVLFLPPMLIGGAFYTPLVRFRRQLPGILSLAVGAVVFTTLVVGVVVHWLAPQLPWAACFALGAIVSPPDAVAAGAVLKGVKLPRRLTTLVEGESLLNDATGLILFRFAVAATLTGAFEPGAAVRAFAFLALGGVLVGAAVGSLWVWLVKRLADHRLIVLATMLLSWTAYLAGEVVHVSGVIAVVVAGLIAGWFQHTVMPAYVRLQGRAANETLEFVLEALVFILIGFSLRGVMERAGGLEALGPMAGVVLAVVITVTLARFVWIIGSDSLAALAWRGGFKRVAPLGWRQGVALGWAGMRGVVTLAIALTLPLDMPGRDLMLVCAFAVIFATVILQGSSLGWIIGLVRPVDVEPPAAVAMAEAEVAIARARVAVVEKMAVGPDGKVLHPNMLERHRKQLAFLEKYAADAEVILEKLQDSFDLTLKAHAAGRAELIRLHRAGLIEDEVLHNLERDLDIEEIGLAYQRSSE